MKIKYIIIAVAVVFLLAIGAFFLLQGKGPSAPTEMNTPEDISAVHMAMDPTSLPGLEAVIKGDGDNYTRERAVITYADIAFRSGNGEQAMGFLKGVAYDEQNDEVRTSAYANYYWLKEAMDVPSDSSMEVAVSGDLKTGNNITVLVTVSGSRPTTDFAEISCGGVDLGNHSVTTGGSPDTGVVLNTSTAGSGAFSKAWVLPPDMVRKNITEMPLTVPFTVYLRESGQSLVKCRLEARYDRLDYDELEKDILLDIGPASGTYEIKEVGQ